MEHENVLVCGLARSGLSAARLLKTLGARVTVQDVKADVGFDPEAEGFSAYLGREPDDIIGDFGLVVISPGISVYKPFVERARALGIPVWGELELAFRHCPCPVIAITGTNGKTSVTTLAGGILQGFYPNTVIAGNIGAPFCDYVRSLPPDGRAVAEVSSFQLETVVNFAPRISAILNVTPDHLDRHRTMDGYRAVKERIFAKQRPGDYCVLNYDDPVCRAMTPPCERVFFSAGERLETGVFLDGNNIRARLFGYDITVADVTGIKTLPENALAAVAVALCAGVPAEVAARGLLTFTGVPHRVEYVRTVGGVRFYNDSKATNPASAIKALEAFEGDIVLIGGGYDKHVALNDWVARFPGRVRHLVVIGETAEQIAEACRAVGFADITRAGNLRDAVALAYEKAAGGGTVLLSPACASWDMFVDFEERGNLFKQFVSEI
uniref:UDP-N-acetylmuramoylalanine--D-glutamate ligase n=1 Tax=uncultured bacterium contig00034 TaxID=1181523 RepID=A0A806JYS0_9BACT|nr:UDP-N-acetylmuramoylalanine--D-glutamate ligase [uncultured bacterium contig00034]